MPRIILFSQDFWLAFKQGSWKDWNQTNRFHLLLYLTSKILWELHKLLMLVQQVLIWKTRHLFCDFGRLYSENILFFIYVCIYVCVCTHIYNPSMQPKLFLYHTPTTTYHVFYGNILNLYNSLVLWKWCLILKILKHPQEKKKKKSWYHV